MNASLGRSFARVVNNELLGSQVLTTSEAIPAKDREFAVRLFRECPEIRFASGRFTTHKGDAEAVDWGLVSASLILQVIPLMEELSEGALERFIGSIEPVNAARHAKRLRTILSTRLVELATAARNRLLFDNPITHSAMEVPE